MVVGYSTDDRESYTTTFSNRWASLYGATHESALHACLVVFVAEYNEESLAALEAIEKWIETHDTELEATKPQQSDA